MTEETAQGAQATRPSGSLRYDAHLDTVPFALSAAGVPIGIFALRRLGRLGGLLLEVASGALFVRAIVMVAAGTPRRLRAIPRLLLFAETCVDGLAVAAGFWAWVWQPFIRHMMVERADTGARRRQRVRT